MAANMTQKGQCVNMRIQIHSRVFPCKPEYSQTSTIIHNSYDSKSLELENDIAYII